MGERQSKAYWQKDEDAPTCNLCGSAFTLFLRRHHCRNCGFVFCKSCSSHTCPIPMRGIRESVRVCDPCFSALIASSRGGPAPPMVTSAAGLYEDDSRAPALLPENAGVGGESRERLSGSPSFVAAPRRDASVEPLAAVSEEPGDSDEGMSGGYQDAYGTEAEQQQQQASSHVAPEQMEREILARQWAAVRQETHFVDVLVQRAEKVGPTTMVEYSRETEAVTLQPEVSPQVLGATVLPLPQPVENSARYLMEPVRLWTRNNSKDLFDLEAAAVAIAPQLQPHVPQDAIRRACPTQFSEA